VRDHGQAAARHRDAVARRDIGRIEFGRDDAEALVTAARFAAGNPAGGLDDAGEHQRASFGKL
jgi:hypothetical protein